MPTFKITQKAISTGQAENEIAKAVSNYCKNAIDQGIQFLKQKFEW